MDYTIAIIENAESKLKDPMSPTNAEHDAHVIKGAADWTHVDGKIVVRDAQGKTLDTFDDLPTTTIHKLPKSARKDRV